MKAKPLISPDLLELVVNESEDGIVIAEQEGDENILIYVNKGFEKLTGYSADEILYQDCRFLQGDDRDQPALDQIRQAIKEGRPCRETLRNYRKDGSLFWNELSITPVYNDQDQLTYYIGVQKDVTELVELRQAAQNKK
ncbi:PAS domain-containing protein [Marinospirillum perlucidum]|uniref:PAS domain-containing protein n=1 Tax=Marinospirillum perlucidum TaxID=1982602 RepID=UPI000DF3D377|nr:PAS domain-containing protein [Marinospirillum perlucidum]